MFGCDKYNIKPYLVSIAKGLSSAYMPIGVVLACREVSDDGIKAFSASPIIGEIRGTGFLVATEFADNKSPNDPFPPEWGVDEIDELISKYGKALKATEERVKELKDQKKKLLISFSEKRMR
ncbi:hypothetical protein POM88_036833 [Heracleum sosnowskyi]|uniref:Uncharacterized protein n=1 Tax=Heracleum sosnowskyi TaxID=360622 RepID=A0AAD8MER9_9APIA|nr:hypothetical protein POM88_036833 [Heracleum sosnowskyi]